MHNTVCAHIIQYEDTLCTLHWDTIWHCAQVATEYAHYYEDPMTLYAHYMRTLCTLYSKRTQYDTLCTRMHIIWGPYDTLCTIYEDTMHIIWGHYAHCTVGGDNMILYMHKYCSYRIDAHYMRTLWHSMHTIWGHDMTLYAEVLQYICTLRTVHEDTISTLHYIWGS